MRPVSQRLAGAISGFILLICIGAPSALGSETDAYTFRFTEIEDALPHLDTEMNRRLKAAARDANEDSAGCSKKELFEELRSRLSRPLYGKFEGWINASRHVPKRMVFQKDSVYRHLQPWHSFPIHLGPLGLGSVLRVGGVLVGTDKFGHFLDEGRHYFEMIRDEGASLVEAMEFGIATEEGKFGRRATGVKSFGDLVANFNGMRFWSSVTGRPYWGPYSREEETYFRCVNGNWYLRRPFTWAEYVDHGWDEGINCSTYRSESFKRRVDRGIADIEKESGRALPCPIRPAACEKLARKYGELAPRLLSPGCR